MDNVCLERLERTVKKYNGDVEIPSEKLARIIVDLTWCFIQFARSRQAVSDERNSWKYWFKDRVLPQLVTWAILGVIAWLTLVNHHITVVP